MTVAVVAVTAVAAAAGIGWRKFGPDIRKFIHEYEPPDDAPDL